MARQVQQHTFDAIVREAMEEFGLSAEEAVADAQEQLRKTGVTDFSNISLSTSTPTTADQFSDSVIANVNDLSTALDQPQPDLKQLEVVVRTLLSSFTITTSDAGDAIASRLINTATHAGAIELSARTLSLASPPEINNAPQNDALRLAGATCDLITALADRDEARQVALCAIPPTLLSLRALLHHCACSRALNIGLSALRATIALQRRSERAKRVLASEHGLPSIVALADVAASHTDFADRRVRDVFVTSCRAARQLVVADDASVDVSEAVVRARALTGIPVASESGVQAAGMIDNAKGDRIIEGRHLVTLLADVSNNAICISTKEKGRAFLLRECVATVAALCIADDICREVWESGVVGSSVEAARELCDDEGIVLATTKLLRGIAGRDECKTDVFRLVQEELREAAFHHAFKNAQVAEAVLAVLGQVSLRRMDIASGMASGGLLGDVLDVMRTHANKAAVSRTGANVVRNVCARSEECRRFIRDAGGETVCRNILAKFPRECDVAYYALREMDVLRDDELRRDTRYKF